MMICGGSEYTRTAIFGEKKAHGGEVPVSPDMRRHQRVGVLHLPEDKDDEQQDANDEHSDDVGRGPAVGGPSLRGAAARVSMPRSSVCV